jgi:thiamine-phosphate pyrophosphorylase
MRRDRVDAARLYLVLDIAAEAVLRPALEGGVQMVQLRDKDADDDALLAAGGRYRAACREHDALFWVNDRPDLALELDADGVHVGQDDAPLAAVRRQAPGLLVGTSTHTPAQLEQAIRDGADQISVGPVWETPTKAGRPATGLGFVRHAARAAAGSPWFAIGGIDARNIKEVARAGAERVVVMRALTEASDPRAAAMALLRALEAPRPSTRLTSGS